MTSYFSRQHYELMADELRKATPEIDSVCNWRWARLVEDISDLFARDNPNYKPAQFLERAGYYIRKELIEQITNVS